MSRLKHVIFGTTLLTAVAAICSVTAAETPNLQTAASVGHGFSGGAHGAPSGGGFHGSAPSGGSHFAMPPHGFHQAPPTFHGSLPPAGQQGHAPHVFGTPGHDIGAFHGHDFAHFTSAERLQWQHGGWHHEWHHGHFGWWWFAGGAWFFYPQPIYPYPEYIGPDYYYDYDNEFGPPAYYWYFCADPEGYFPDVQQCNVPWQAVPPTPDSQ